MKCHEVGYKIFGDDMQTVEVELDPGEAVIAEAGAMNWMEDGISFEAKMGDGSEPDRGFMGKLFEAGKRAVTGESLFMTHFTNQGREKKRVAFSAPYPGKIIPVDMSKAGGELICQKDAFLCAALGTKVTIAFTRKLGGRIFRRRGLYPPASPGGRDGLCPRRRHHCPEAAPGRNPSRGHRLHRGLQPRHQLRY